MKPKFALLIGAMAVLLFTGLLAVSAQEMQDGYPLGYQETFIPPEDGMLPLNYTCTVTVYDAGRGMAKLSVPARVDAYIIWKVPARPADYKLSYTVDNIAYWAIWTRDTLAQVCPAKRESITGRMTRD